MDFLQGFLDLLSDLTLVYLIIFIGIIWRFSRFYNPIHGKWVTSIIVWVFFPISIIGSFSEIDTLIGTDLFVVILIAVVAHTVSFLSSYFFTRNNHTMEKGAMVMCGTFPNTLLFPFPIILAILGTSAIFYAAIYVFTTMVLRNTFGVMIGIWLKVDETNHNTNIQDKGEIAQLNIKKLLLDILKFPPFLATILGFVLHFLIGPQAMRAIPGMDMAKTIALYGSLLLVGLSFQNISQLHPRNFYSQITLRVSTTRFLISPVFVLIVLLLLEAPSIIAIPVLIQSMAPPAVSNIVYGKFFNLSESDMGQLITTLTLLALIILPLELIIILFLFPIH